MRPLAVASLAVALPFCCAVSARAQDLQLRDGPLPDRSQIVEDIARGRVVVVGFDGETAEWDGQRWLQRPARLPGATQWSLAYDRVKGRMVGVGRGETWEFDGAAWRQQATTTTPFGAGGGVPIAFDAVRGRTVAFGLGFAADETWTWDGSTWQQQQPLVVPPGRAGAAMSYDSARSRVVLFGGANGNTLADTWEWDGVAWTQRLPAVSPPPRVAHAMAYDAGRQRTVLFGGQDLAFLGDLWEYDGTTWQAIVPTGLAPSPRGYAKLTTEPGSSELWLLGGMDANVNLRDGYRWNGVRWAAHAGLPAQPDLPAGFSATSEPATGATLLFGGAVGVARPVSDELWSWHNGAWSLVATGGPSPRGLATMWNDLQDVYLFGGTDFALGAQLGDLWRWRNGTWTSLPAIGPVPRSEAGVAFDVAHNCAVLFGGVSGSTQFNDTWTFDGVAWQNHVTAQQPSPRQAHGMAADLVRGRVVLFGGSSGNFLPWQNDTWEWNGSSWTQIATTAAPPATGHAALAFDFAHNRVVAAQRDLNGNGNVQIYEYDGSRWSLIPIASEHQVFSNLAAVEDVAHQRVSILTGTTLLEFVRSPASATSYGLACGTVPPVLAARTLPRLGAVDFALDLGLAPPNSAVGIVGGTALANVPVGACSLVVAPILASVVLVSDARGNAALPLPVPSATGLLGTTLLFQGAALDPTAAGGFTASRGLRIVVGN